MAVVVDRDECTGCGSCEEVCPTGAIVVKDDDVAAVDADECTDCESCVDECPTGAISGE
ncbi:4Fe-4S binding protein [Metallumcola ferriviriculae]|uniref:Ferredoxin n=1 Tax=Metallumcola ferriviriculae TaxID=3039180 RepID=A0AAU0UQS3_9FIRM|nr:4Fe-4S binding protein [Desulfitibacteraceae bacterium MK1]